MTSPNEEAMKSSEAAGCTVGPCGCIAEVNGLMAERNTRIMLRMFGLQQPFVETCKVDQKKRGKPVRMFASFCPFCGKPYQSDDAALALAVKS